MNPSEIIMSIKSEDVIYFERRSTTVESAPDSYPHKFEVSTTIPHFRELYSSLGKGEISDHVESIAGRVYSTRIYGKNLVFVDIQGGDPSESEVQNHLQIVFNKKQYEGEENMKAVYAAIYRGDILGFVGKPYCSNTGELSLVPTSYQLLAPCKHLMPKPEVEMEGGEKSSGGLSDDLTIFRKRYLDMIVNHESRNMIILRSKTIREMRNFLEEHGFIEINTPVLSATASGATAKPFTTYHNEFKREMQLRIAPELNLKRLVVGGIDKVYEIGPQFRNEGVDLTHNPEFFTCEFYWAYADYNDLMEFTEKMLYGISQKFSERKSDVDWTPPYERIDIVSEIKEQLSKSGSESEFPDCSFESDEMREFLDSVCVERGFECSEPRTTARLFDTLVEELVEPLCKGNKPVFLIHHPKIISPLAKSHRSDPEKTERFELFVKGFELANAYTELNDPVEQKERFLQQAKDKADGDDEAPEPDLSFVEALEYGLPPTAGWGMGIERLIMLMFNKDRIKDVIPFPMSRVLL